ncbi:MAG: hypothetical protein ABFD25_00915 [Clostridiaceae bacterium]
MGLYDIACNDNMTGLQTMTEYIPTQSEQKLLDVLLSPEHRLKSITDICKVAGCSRVLYYSAFKKSEFNALYKQKSKELVDQSIAPVLNTFVREALRGSFQHGKVILEMAGLYSEKQQIDVSGDINVNLSRSEIQQRIADILSKKQLKSAIDADYKVVDDPDK